MPRPNTCSYDDAVGTRLRADEVESLIRSAAMAPLAPDRVRATLEDHRVLLLERDELVRLVTEMLPAWAELQAALNELATQLDG
jgi:hypothetical protein